MGREERKKRKKKWRELGAFAVHPVVLFSQNISI
jgi:hypothetical protein